MSRTLLTITTLGLLAAAPARAQVEEKVMAAQLAKQSDAKTETETENLPATIDVQQEQVDRFRELRRSDAELDKLKQVAAATKVFFEYTSSSVRNEYWRDLKQLAESILATPDGAVAISGFASPRLPTEEAKRVGDRRSLGAAAKLNALGVSWDRILILSATGESTFPAPHWRNHRVEFSPRVMLYQPEQTTVELARPPEQRSEAAVRKAIPIDSDSLSRLASQAVIYFGAGNEEINEVDRRALREIARMLSSKRESRSLVIQSLVDGDVEAGGAEVDRCQRRQNAVLDCLLDFNAPPERLLIRTQAMSADEAAEPSWKQRRVELIVHEG